MSEFVGVKGIGVDIVLVPRIKAALENTPGFAQRVLTESELEQMSERKQQANFVAKRFAAKEAVVKSLGQGIRNGISWQDIEISNDSFGAPKVTLTGAALNQMRALGANECLISLSDESDTAIAFAMLN